MAVDGNIQTDRNRKSSSYLKVLVILLLFFTSASGFLCSVFEGQCRRDCDKSEVITVTPYVLCDGELMCCKRKEQQSNRALDNRDLSGGQFPYFNRQPYQHPYNPRPFQPAPPTTTTWTPPSTAWDNHVMPSHNSCGVRGHSRVRRIVNGVKAERCRYPWMVLLDRGTVPWDTCGASLISDRHIISAAHCFGGLPSRPVLVLGEYDKNEYWTGSKVRTANYNITIHPLYDNALYVNDIALITLATPLDLSKYECLRPICLPDQDEEPPVGSECIVAGWGMLQREIEAGRNPRTSNVLQETTIRVVRPALCRRVWTSYRQDIQICAGDMSGLTDSCRGDSGGPLMCSTGKNKDVYYLHGVVSLGSTPCAVPGVPALYTKVGKYRSWIQEMMDRK